MSNSRAPEVEDFVTRTCADAEKIVRELLPAKMRDLDVLLTSDGMSKFNVNDEDTFVALERAISEHIAAGRPLAAEESSTDEDEEEEGEDDGAATRKVGAVLRSQRDATLRSHTAANQRARSAPAAAGAGKGAPAGKGDTPALARLSTVPMNAVLSKFIETLRAHVLEASQLLSTVKVWIQVNIPRIEDGNNFGVQVQEEVLSEAHRIEENVYAAMSSVSKYYSTRARHIAKCIKHENVEDYKQTVREIDFMQFINVRTCLRDLRNNYAVLHDLVVKNMDRIKKPRGTSGAAMASMY